MCRRTLSQLFIFPLEVRHVEPRALHGKLICIRTCISISIGRKVIYIVLGVEKDRWTKNAREKLSVPFKPFLEWSQSSRNAKISFHEWVDGSNTAKLEVVAEKLGSLRVLLFKWILYVQKKIRIKWLIRDLSLTDNQSVSVCTYHNHTINTWVVPFCCEVIQNLRQGWI